MRLFILRLFCRKPDLFRVEPDSARNVIVNFYMKKKVLGVNSNYFFIILCGRFLLP